MNDAAHQEYILKKDGNFYRRTVVESILANQQNALASVKLKPTFYVTPFTSFFKLSDEENALGYSIKSAFYAKENVSTSQDTVYYFVRAPYFYFSGAGLERYVSDNPEEEKPYRLHIPYDNEHIAEGKEILRSSNLSSPVRWFPQTDGLMMFFMFSMTFSNNSAFRAGNPYVFVHDRVTKASYAPNLPNVYESGEICAGENFPRDTRDFDIFADQSLELIKTCVTDLNTSLCNNDLRDPSAETNYLKFDSSGLSIPTDSNSIVEDHKTFFLETKHEAILDFSLWLNHQQA